MVVQRTVLSSQACEFNPGSNSTNATLGTGTALPGVCSNAGVMTPVFQSIRRSIQVKKGLFPWNASGRVIDQPGNR